MTLRRTWIMLPDRWEDESKVNELINIVRPYRITDGKRFRLKRISPRDTGNFETEGKEEAQALLRHGVERLSELQEMLYAQDRWAVLLIFQGMDAAGKDGTIKHVMSGINPQGCQVYSFKVPSAEEQDHDFMWRTTRCLPERGRIGIFNRSYYEEVAVVRVHNEILDRQKLPPQLKSPRIWQERFEDIRNFERYLARNGVAILKFFLHLSREEQKERFLSRLDKPKKHWKFSAADVNERGYWKAYSAAYEEMIRNTADDHAPWYVVPADKKWYTRMLVAAAIVEGLESLNLQYPAVSARNRRELRRARKILLNENDRED